MHDILNGSEEEMIRSLKAEVERLTLQDKEKIQAFLQSMVDLPHPHIVDAELDGIFGGFWFQVLLYIEKLQKDTGIS